MGQVLAVNLKLTNYLFETSTMLDIVQTAKIGQIRLSLISTQVLFEQLINYMKVSLPKGSDLPVEL